MFEALEKTVGGFAPGDRAVGRFTSAQSMIVVAANVAIIIAMGVSIITLAYSFIQFVTSTGDEKLLEKAQRSVMWSVLGFILALVAFALKNILMKAIGISGI